jgi:hypothetical protein
MAVLLAGTSAFAGFTQVKPPPAGEMGRDQILSHLYGGTFVASGNHYTNGTITAYRIEDQSLASGPMNILSGSYGSASDQTWHGDFTARAVAKFSLNQQTLGFDRGNGFEKLFDVTGYGFAINNASKTIHTDADFCFNRKGDSGNQCSINSENIDARDHMVTYCIEGAGANKWLMFWEDINLSQNISKRRSSSDFNDLVIEVSPHTHVAAVPLPPTVYTGLMMLVSGGVVRALRRLKK